MKTSALVSVFFVLVSGTLTHAQSGWKTTQLTDNSYLDDQPQVSYTLGNFMYEGPAVIVAWRGWKSNGSEIFVSDGSNTSQLSTNDHHDVSPQAVVNAYSGSHEKAVVWQGGEYQNRIVYWNGDTARELPSDQGGYHPQVDPSGRYFVWEGYASGQKNIFLYDKELQSLKQLTNHVEWGYYADQPQISREAVVWRESDGNDAEVVFHSPTTGNTIQLTDNEHADIVPQVSLQKVVWEGYFGTHSEIFLHDGATGVTRQLTDTGRWNKEPQIDGSNVVWYGSDGNDHEIFLYDTITRTTTLLTDNDYDDLDPRIDGSRVVWRGGSTYAEHEIFVHDIDYGYTTQLTQNDYLDAGAQVSGPFVVWSGNGEIFLAEKPTSVCSASLLAEGEQFKGTRILKDIIRKSVLYRFRDEVMGQSADGKKYIDLYYEHTSEFARMMLRDPDLALRSAKMLARLAPQIQAAVDRKPTSLSPDDIVAAEKLLNLVAAKSSPNLQAAIERVRGDLHAGTLTSLFTAQRPQTVRVTVGGG